MKTTTLFRALCAMILAAMALALAGCNNGYGGGNAGASEQPKKEKGASTTSGGGEKKEETKILSDAELKAQQFAKARKDCDDAAEKCDEKADTANTECEKRCGDNAKCKERAAAQQKLSQAQCGIAKAKCLAKVDLAEAKYKGSVLIADATKDCHKKGGCGGKAKGGSDLKPVDGDDEGPAKDATPQSKARGNGPDNTASADDGDDEYVGNCVIDGVSKPSAAECRRYAVLMGTFASADRMGRERARQ